MTRREPAAPAAAAASADPTPRPSPAAFVVLALAALIVFAGLVALGTWQVHRLSWKLALIARVDNRIHAPPVAPPGPKAWPKLDATADEYLHVRMSGTFLNDRRTLVQAATELGAGFWVVTPLQTNQGFTVLVNRGFVPPERRDPTSLKAGEIAGETTVTGLLRLSEPKGGFLRRNDAAADRWFSRDVAAIAAARKLSDVAPYFVDADAQANLGGFPVGGLTIVSFPNNHLVYALTWYALAAMLAGVGVWAARDEWRRRRGASA